MYNDVWRRIQVLEGLVKDSMSLSNATRRELQDGIRTIAVQIGRRGLVQSDRDRQEGNGQWTLVSLNSETCLKWNLRIMQTCLWQTNF
jgi:hypothetical protein